MFKKGSAVFGVTLPRDVKVPLWRFTAHFRGFEKVEAVKRIFGGETERVLNELKVEFTTRCGYMSVSEQDGHLIVSTYYLKNGDERDIYLDVIHELVHVKQFMEGKELFDEHFEYVRRPTEVEAYKYAVEEARKIGMTEEEIYEYLKTEWMSESDIKNLAKILGVKPNASSMKI